jgi:hypothetical protein
MGLENFSSFAKNDYLEDKVNALGESLNNHDLFFNDSSSSISSNDAIEPHDQNLHSIDESLESLEFCKVCSDKATGIHYGVATCEGCKVT